MEKPMCPSEIYTTMAIARADCIDEKQAMFELYLKIYFGMMYRFKGNSVLPEVLGYLAEYFSLFFNDANYEHEVYDRVIQFFDDLDVEDLDKDYKDEGMLNLLSQLIEYFDVSCEKRLIAFAQFSTHYEMYIEQGWMDKYNYEYAPYDDEHIMEDEEKIQILNLFPKKRHDD